MKHNFYCETLPKRGPTGKPEAPALHRACSRARFRARARSRGVCTRGRAGASFHGDRRDIAARVGACALVARATAKAIAKGGHAVVRINAQPLPR